MKTQSSELLSFCHKIAQTYKVDPVTLHEELLLIQSWIKCNLKYQNLKFEELADYILTKIPAENIPLSRFSFLLYLFYHLVQLMQKDHSRQ